MGQTYVPRTLNVVNEWVGLVKKAEKVASYYKHSPMLIISRAIHAIAVAVFAMPKKCQTTTM